MKRTMLLMLLLCTAYAFAAADEPAFRVFKISEANAYRVIYANPSSGMIELEIRDSERKTLYRSVYHAPRGIKLPLDFSALRNGRYYVTIRDGKNLFKQEIDHVYEAHDFVFHASPLVGDPKKYLISIITPSRASVTLSVYDVHGQTLHQRHTTVRKQDALVLNLAKFKGPFVFELTDATGKKRALSR